MNTGVVLLAATLVAAFGCGWARWWGWTTTAAIAAAVAWFLIARASSPPDCAGCWNDTGTLVGLVTWPLAILLALAAAGLGWSLGDDRRRRAEARRRSVRAESTR